MLGNTHIAIGIATSLAITQPKTIPETLCAITGGVIGASISDLDHTRKRESLDYRDEPFGWQIYVFVVVGLVLLLGIDYVAGDGVVDHVIKNFGIQTIVAGVAFLGICFFGMTTYHRTFMHSFLAGILLTLSLFLLCEPLTYPFAIGFASHLFIDFFNTRKIQYFWPLPWKIGLNKYPSDGKLNDFICAIGTIASIFLSAHFFINNLAGSALLEKIHTFFSMPVKVFGFGPMPRIIPYLSIINIVSFIVHILDAVLYGSGLWFYDCPDEDAREISEFIVTLYLIIDFAGGMIGKLLAVFLIFGGKIYKKESISNFNFYIIPLCSLISWITLLTTFFMPEFAGWNRPLHSMRLVFLVYFAVINVLTMINLPKVQQFANVITPREKFCMLTSFLGGASGGFISIKMTKEHSGASMLIYTLPEMMIMHAIVMSCLFLPK